MNYLMKFHSEKNRQMKKYFSLLLTSLILSTAGAQKIPDPMQPPRMVNDFSQLLKPEERQQLEKKLQDFYFKTSTQIYIVILDDLDGYDIAGYSFRLGEKWGIGSKGKDNGILILLNPSKDRKHGDVFIASGYGLESVIPDAKANRIVDYDMIPYFKNLDYYGGLSNAVNTLMELTRGEYTMDEYIQRHTQSSQNVPAIVIFFFIFFILSFIGRARRARHYSAGHNIPFWTALFLASGAGRSHSGSFGNFSSGSGGFGGFGGGGFGGGGGGSFGGGGAGGSW